MSSLARIEELEKKFAESPRRFFAPLANEYRKAGDTARAIELCRAHLELQPNHMSGQVVLGQALFDAGFKQEAQSAFEVALSLDPENLIALRHLGDMARQIGDYGAAKKWYMQVLDVDSRNHEVMTIIREIDEIISAGTFPTPERGEPVVATPEASDSEVVTPPGPATADFWSAEENVAPESASIEPALFQNEPVSPTEPHLNERAEDVVTFGWESARATASTEDVADLFHADPPLFSTVTETALRMDTAPDPTFSEKEFVPARAELTVLTPEPAAIVPEAGAATPEPLAADPGPMAAPESLFVEPGPVFIEPEAVFTEPEAVLAEPETVSSEPDLLFAEPETVSSEPDLLFAEPETVSLEPDLVFAEPDIVPAQPDLVLAAPEPVLAEGEHVVEPVPPDEPDQDMDDALFWEMEVLTSEINASQEARTTDGWASDFDVAGDPTEAELQREIVAGLDWPDSVAPDSPDTGAADMSHMDLLEGGDPDNDSVPVQTPAVFITETMAQLYEQQGYLEMSAAVYRQLLDRNPGSEHLKGRIADLDRRVAGRAEPSRTPRIGVAEEGDSARDFFSSLVRVPLRPRLARPYVSGRSEAEQDVEGTGAGGSIADAGSPAREATNALSLESVFRNGGGASGGRSGVGGSAGFSFDQFFVTGGQAPPAPAPSEREPRANRQRRGHDSEEIEQFNSWLEGLKRS